MAAQILQSESTRTGALTEFSRGGAMGADISHVPPRHVLLAGAGRLVFQQIGSNGLAAAACFIQRISEVGTGSPWP